MGVDCSDAHIDLVGFIYEQGRKVVHWALFMNREERLSHRRELYRLRRETETTRHFFQARPLMFKHLSSFKQAL